MTVVTNIFSPMPVWWKTYFTEVETMLSERVKEWNKESLERGIQQGIKKGTQKGIRHGALQMLKRQLEVKFGCLPDDVITQLNKADEETILNWSEHILVAKSLGDIFGH